MGDLLRYSLAKMLFSIIIFLIVWSPQAGQAVAGSTMELTSQRA